VNIPLLANQMALNVMPFHITSAHGYASVSCAKLANSAGDGYVEVAENTDDTLTNRFLCS
jgi:hypothetical protein